MINKKEKSFNKYLNGVDKYFFLFILFFIIIFTILFYLRASLIKAPLIITDEVQYYILAENLYRYGKFLLRGHIPATIPPLYSVILFIFKKIFCLKSHQYYQLINSFLFSCSLIPSYLISRHFKISKFNAILLAIVIIQLPYSLYITTCMSENLYFLLFLFFIYACLLFYDELNFFTAVLVGIIWGLCILTKLSAIILMAIFIATNIIISFLYILTKWYPDNFIDLYKFFLFTFISFIIGLLLYMPWLLLKLYALRGFSHNLLGAYNNNILVVINRFLNLHTVKIICIYISDIFFASGFILLPSLLFIECRHFLYRDIHYKMKILFLFLVILGLVLLASFFSGLTTGWLRERHMFLIIPLIIILFFKNFDFYNDRETGICLFYINLLILILALLGLDLYNFHIASPVIETPWVNFLKLYKIFNIKDSYILNHINLFILPIIIMLSSIWLFPVRHKHYLFYIWLIVYFVLSSNITYLIMHKWSQLRLHDEKNKFITWVEHSIGTQKKLLIFGRPAYFEAINKNEHFNFKLISWNEHFLLSDIFIYRLEMAGAYDIRMIPSLYNLKKYINISNSNVFLLSALEVSGIKKKAEFGPLILYCLCKSNSNILLRYETDIDPRCFFSLTGNLIKNNNSYIIESKAPGFAVYGPYWRLPIGNYQIIYSIYSPIKSLVTLDAYSKKLGELAKKTLLLIGYNTPMLKLDIKKDTPKIKYEFRIYLKKGYIKFYGVHIILK